MTQWYPNFHNVYIDRNDIELQLPSVEEEAGEVEICSTAMFLALEGNIK